MKVKIEELRNRLECIPTIVEWLYQEWGNHNRNYWTSWIQYSTQEKDIPRTYVLFVDDHIAGTYSLWRCDLHQDRIYFHGLAVYMLISYLEGNSTMVKN